MQGYRKHREAGKHDPFRRPQQFSRNWSFKKNRGKPEKEVKTMTLRKPISWNRIQQAQGKEETKVNVNQGDHSNQLRTLELKCSMVEKKNTLRASTWEEMSQKEALTGMRLFTQHLQIPPPSPSTEHAREREGHTKPQPVQRPFNHAPCLLRYQSNKSRNQQQEEQENS